MLLFEFLSNSSHSTKFFKVMPLSFSHFIVMLYLTASFSEYETCFSWRKRNSQISPCNSWFDSEGAREKWSFATESNGNAHPHLSTAQSPRPHVTLGQSLKPCHLMGQQRKAENGPSQVSSL